jgi:peptidoglycan/xylan/chitin deacetylase (PgdA/CDA1 family)
VIRGDTTKKEIALVFTGDTFADGAQVIIDALKVKNIKASFFLTGNFYKSRAFRAIIMKLKEEGHYLGAHSDRHLLYADWDERDSLLVTRAAFRKDLKRNYRRMSSFRIRRDAAPYFLPPFEWYNKTIADWTRREGLHLVNFSPGTLSTADYTYPGMKNYRSSEEIYNSILEYEQTDPNGLNGFIMLTHIGTDGRRTDKLYHKLVSLITELQAKGYTFVRIDELLQ